MERIDKEMERLFLSKLSRSQMDKVLKELNLSNQFSNKDNIAKRFLNNVGDVVDLSVVISYIEELHHMDDIHLGSITVDEVNSYSQYKLEPVSLSSLDLDQYDYNSEDVEIFKNQYLKTGYYPPIILSNTYSIIDGAHRANSLKLAGEKSILAFVGIEKKINN